MQVHQLPEVSGLRGFAFAMGFGAIITAALTLVLSLFNWRWLLKPVLTVLQAVLTLW
jgi:glucan phosphoethanolaminetransferase (alkaline phosphatase superfamily)